MLRHFTHHICTGLVGLFTLLSTVVSAESLSLFNGTTLEGWEGNAKVWSVKDGAIYGGSMEGNPINEFLTTKRSFRNFKLKLEYKLVGTEGFVNGGVQFRSLRIASPPNEMIGYQADIGAGYTGSLYDESRRKVVLAQADKALIEKTEKGGEWNHYEIHALGSRVLIRLNGKTTIDYVEKDGTLSQDGLIGLQIHGNCKAVIAFRNLQIETLPDDDFPTEAQALKRLEPSSSATSSAASSNTALPLQIQPQEVIAFIGQTNWINAQKHGVLEAQLGRVWSEKKPVFRWLAWEADTVYEQWRDINFGSWHSQLKSIGAQTLLVQMGQMEALEGERKIPEFVAAYHRLLDELQSDGRRVILISPTRFEASKASHGRDLRSANDTLGTYVASIQDIAKQRGLRFINLFADPQLANDSASHTDNGVHWNEQGLQAVAQVLTLHLSGSPTTPPVEPEILQAIHEKNRLWLDCWRPANWSFVYGDRVSQMFGKAGGDQPSLRQTFENHREWISKLDAQIHALQLGETTQASAPPASLTTSAPNAQLSVEAQKKTFELAAGYEINLFAGEDLGVVKPTQMAWDEKGRLYVACSPTYPHMQLGGKPGDYILVLEDTDGDGKADRSWKFAEGLTMVQGLEVGKSGLYVCDYDQIAFYADSDGDGKADRRDVLMSGFGVGDTHQLANSICYGPDGSLWFSQGLHAFSRVETPWGIARLDKAGIWKYRPRTQKLEGYFNGGKAGHNCWGVAFDDQFQVFHKSGDRPDGYYSVPGLISIKDPDEYHGIGSLFKTHPKTTGLEFIGTSALPKKIQGHVLIAGYFGSVIEIHRLVEDGAGFRSEQLPKLMTSSDQSFRPVDITVGPEGAIYVADWFNPVIGHYQASYADPRRDRNHGRIWRIRHTESTPTQRVNLAKASVAELLQHLHSKERWVRLQAKRLLFQGNLSEIQREFDKAIQQPGTLADEAWFAEMAGVFASHETLPQTLLDSLLQSQNPAWRAFGTRLAGDFLEKGNASLSILDRSVQDEHPRVRLESVVALAKQEAPSAVEVAAKVLDHPQDRFLTYALDQSLRALRPHYADPLNAGKLSFDGKVNRLDYVNKKFHEGPIQRHPGQPIYEALCLNCHQPDGKGLGDIYPPIADSDWVTGDKSVLIRILLHGLQGELKVKDKTYGVINPLPMPPSGLQDQEIADVLTYIRQNFDNHAGAVSTEEVRQVRQAFESRKAPWQVMELRP